MPPTSKRVEKYIKITPELPESLLIRLRAYSHNQGPTIAWTLTQAITEYLDKHDTANPVRPVMPTPEPVEPAQEEAIEEIPE